jgi:Mrp family chromosome partitioning ATPase
MPTAARPLLLCADELLTDDVLRLAAVTGVELELAVDPGAVRSRYGRAPLVLLGADLAVRADRLPRRSAVILVARQTEPRDVYPLAQRLSAEFVACLPAAQDWLLARLADTAAGEPRGRVLGVVGGRGGAGASTLAVALAVTGVRVGLSTLLIDADPMGGGIDLALGWEGVEGLRWPALAGASGRIDPGLLTRALPGRGPLTVLSWARGSESGARAPILAETRPWMLADAWDLSPVPPREEPGQAESMIAALDAGRRAADLVVLDLPRYPDLAAAAGIAAAYRIFVVVPAELRATAAALAVVDRYRQHGSELAAVVRGPAPGGLRADQVAAAVGLPLAGQLRAEPGLATALERGVAPAGSGRGPLAELCRTLLRDAEVRP